MYDLKLTPEQFWALTPRLFSALSDRLDSDMRLREAQTALVAAFFANVWAKKKQGEYEPSEFTVYDRLAKPEEKEPEPKEMTPWEQFEYIRALNRRLGGREELIDS